MRQTIYEAMVGLPGKALSNGIGVLGLAATLKPDKINAVLDKIMTPQQTQLWGVGGIIVALIYWVIVLLLKPPALHTAPPAATVVTTGPDSQVGVITNGFGSFVQTRAGSDHALLSAELEHFKKIHQILGGKDESELRDHFDFENILEHNIVIVAGQNPPHNISRGQFDASHSYFIDGQSIVTIKPGQLPFSDGKWKWHMKPGEVIGVNVSKKYVDAVAELKEAANNHLCPSEVRDKITALLEVVGNNASLVTKSLTHSLKNHRLNLIEHANKWNKKLRGSASWRYWHGFSNLEGPVAELQESLRDHLERNTGRKK